MRDPQALLGGTPALEGRLSPSGLPFPAATSLLVPLVPAQEVQQDLSSPSPAEGGKGEGRIFHLPSWIWARSLLPPPSPAPSLTRGM